MILLVNDANIFTAHDKLDHLSKTNPRLPKNECKKRLKKWKQG